MKKIATLTSVAALGVVLLLTQAGSAVVQERPLIDRARFGAYVHLLDRPYSDPVAPEDLAYLEERTGKLDVIHYFVTWGRGFDEFVTPTLDDHDVMLSLKPEWDLIREINRGLQDEYIDWFASRAGAYGRPVYLRFGHEMNGSWMSYSSGAGGPSAMEFVQAWRHLVDRFRLAGAANVRFVWSPNESDVPAVDGNRLEDYWPGPSYVDIAGFDAYNWTDAEPRRGDAENRSFDEIVRGPYERIVRLAPPGTEIWLCEIGTVEPGKADWFRGMFGSRSFPQLTGVIYFSENDQRDTQRDWRIDSSEAAVQAWREALDGRAALRETRPAASR